MGKRDPRFPNSTNAAELADWLELVALVAKDKDSSAGDLERPLKRLNADKKEEHIGSTFLEIDKRIKASGPDAYPFERSDTSIRLRGKASKFPAYIFCLALSYFRWKARTDAEENPWLLFEELAEVSAKNYLQGDSFLFGTSSRDDDDDAKEKFKRNIGELAEKLGEGGGFREQRTFSTKDSSVDIVAWKKHHDGRPSQIILFGQCAGGANWRKSGKLGELDPQGFWDQWLAEGKVSELWRSMFMPFRVFDDEEWKLKARRARLLFDRCRVVANAHEKTKKGDFAKRLIRCCRTEWNVPI